MSYKRIPPHETAVIPNTDDRWSPLQMKYCNHSNNAEISKFCPLQTNFDCSQRQCTARKNSHEPVGRGASPAALFTIIVCFRRQQAAALQWISFVWRVTRPLGGESFCLSRTSNARPYEIVRCHFARWEIVGCGASRTSPPTIKYCDHSNNAEILKFCP